MSGSLKVYLYGRQIGTLSEDSLGHLEFRYDEDAYPLSVRMPVRKETYDQMYAEPFFDNLTPEGDALNLIARKFHISEENTFSVLKQIGGDCAGAVSLYSGKIQPYIDRPLKKIDHEALSKIIEELPTNPLLTGMDNAPRLSLAGAQSKFAVYKGTDGKYYRSDDNTRQHIS